MRKRHYQGTETYSRCAKCNYRLTVSGNHLRKCEQCRPDRPIVDDRYKGAKREKEKDMYYWDGCMSVSYTHLDVYKRQVPIIYIII